MSKTPGSRHPFAEAIEWAARIMAVALEMVLPGMAGQWLDRRFGTSFLALVGFAFGLTAGMGTLLVMTRGLGRQGRTGDGDGAGSK